jgi:hypothetical protein
MNDFSKNVCTDPVLRKKAKPSSAFSRGHGTFVDPSEIGIDNEYSCDHTEDEHGINFGSGFDPKEIGVDHRRSSYDHDEGDHGWHDSRCGNQHDAG